MKKEQKGFALIELISVILLLLSFKATNSVLGLLMIALSVIALLCNSETRSRAISKK